MGDARARKRLRVFTFMANVCTFSYGAERARGPAGANVCTISLLGTCGLHKPSRSCYQKSGLPFLEGDPCGAPGSGRLGLGSMTLGAGGVCQRLQIPQNKALKAHRSCCSWMLGAAVPI